MSSSGPKDTDKLSPFGLETIPAQQKTANVQQVFSSVAPSYDLMNDIMSGGLHRWWKWYLFQLINYSNCKKIADIACGSGDLLLGHAKRMEENTSLIGIDPNEEMLQQARHRLDNNGVFEVELLAAGAEAIPCEDNTIDLITMSFGLRNTTDMDTSLRELYRVLRPGGRLLILEFSHPVNTLLTSVYTQYSKILPHIGGLVAKDKDSYQYLVDSIKTHPNQQKLADKCTNAGFTMVNWINLTGGIVAIHSCYKS